MTAENADLAVVFLGFSRKKLLEQYWPRLRGCVESLTDEQVWWRPNPASNSVGNLILHLNGNVRQWMVASFNRLEDDRDRPAEFNQQEGAPATALLDVLSATMNEASDVLARLSQSDLLARYEIQGYKVTGLDAVYQVVEHFGLHYGQVLYITKNLCAKDLGFYSALNKTGRASSTINVYPFVKGTI
jgi:uncharacterized damage-inducible protein DinB